MNKVKIITIGCSLVAYPLPKKLTRKEILKGAAILNESCFPTAEGKAFIREINALGYTGLSFPDGVRLGFLKQGGFGLTMDEGVAAYKRARKQIAENVEALAKIGVAGVVYH